MKDLESLLRAASRRWRLAVLIAAAVVLPGGVGAGTMAMMPNEADPSSGPALDGTLPFQDDEALEPYLDAQMLAAVPVGADPVSDPVRAVLSSARVIDSLGESGIPSVAVDAYVRAAARLADEDPDCGIRWSLADMYETGAVERPPATGLPPMEPTPPPRPSPGPPQAAPPAPPRPAPAPVAPPPATSPSIPGPPPTTSTSTTTPPTTGPEPTLSTTPSTTTPSTTTPSTTSTSSSRSSTSRPRP